MPKMERLAKEEARAAWRVVRLPSSSSPSNDGDVPLAADRYGMDFNTYH